MHHEIFHSNTIQILVEESVPTAFAEIERVIEWWDSFDDGFEPHRSADDRHQEKHLQQSGTLLPCQH